MVQNMEGKKTTAFKKKKKIPHSKDCSVLNG